MIFAVLFTKQDDFVATVQEKGHDLFILVVDKKVDSVVDSCAIVLWKEE